MKTSGRLKNFCQLCRKLCRDQNGYICHLNSVSHQKRVQQYKSNPKQVIMKYSQDMQRKFIQILKTKYPGEAKHLEVVYNEYETESKRFIKFSNTRWKGLKEFGEYLASGEVKNIKVTGVSPDCYVTYTVNKTMEFIEKNKKEQLELLKEKQKELFEKSLQNRIERQKAHEQRQAKKFQLQMKKVQEEKHDIIIPDRLQFSFDNWGQSGKRNAFISMDELQRQTAKELLEQQNIADLKVNKKLENSQKLLSKITANQQKKHKKHEPNGNSQQSIKQQNEQDQVQWIMPGIIVKIKPHQIDPAFHNKKTKIFSIVQPYVAKVQVGTATLEIDQSFLQTVIPKIGNEVMILNGELKGKTGNLVQVDLTAGFGLIEINEHQERVPFNYFSKYEGQEKNQ